MAKEKEERNQQFIAAWKEEGLSNEALGKKFNLSPGGVKGLKSRLRKKDPSLYIGQRPELTKVSKSPQVDKSTSPLVHKRATYYLSPETIKTIKQIALNREKDASELVREILFEWISQQVDK